MKYTRGQFPTVDWSEFHIWSPNGVFKRLKKDEKNLSKSNATRNLGLGTVTALSGQKAVDGVHSLGQLARNQLIKDHKVLHPFVFGKKFPGGVQKKNMEGFHPHHKPGIMKEAYVQFWGGALGGGTATYTTHWIDTVKVKMQTKPGFYKSGFHCLRQTLQTDGFRALYQGAMPALVGQTAKTAVVFMSYGLCEEAVCHATGCEHAHDLTVWHHAGAGAMTGIAASFVLCPMELIKCRLQALKQVTDQLQSSQQKMLRSMTCTQMMRHIIRKEGLPGLYRGLPGIWVKDVPGSFIYFGSYELAKYGLRRATDKEHLNHREVFFCGMFAGLCFCATHPIETVKTRVQVMSAIRNTRGFVGAMVHIIKTEGLAPLMSGMGPSMVRACLYSGIQFVTFETVREHFLGEDY